MTDLRVFAQLQELRIRQALLAYQAKLLPEVRPTPEMAKRRWVQSAHACRVSRQRQAWRTERTALLAQRMCRCGHTRGSHANAAWWREGTFRGLGCKHCQVCACRGFHLPPSEADHGAS